MPQTSVKKDTFMHQVFIIFVIMNYFAIFSITISNITESLSTIWFLLFIIASISICDQYHLVPFITLYSHFGIFFFFFKKKII